MEQGSVILWKGLQVDIRVQSPSQTQRQQVYKPDLNGRSQLCYHCMCCRNSGKQLINIKVHIQAGPVPTPPLMCQLKQHILIGFPAQNLRLHDLTAMWSGSVGCVCGDPVVV